jgi:hypothetical protein
MNTSNTMDPRKQMAKQDRLDLPPESGARRMGAEQDILPRTRGRDRLSHNLTGRKGDVGLQGSIIDRDKHIEPYNILGGPFFAGQGAQRIKDDI